MAKIYPRCRRDMSGAYVSAEGLVMPCCWMGNHPHIEKYKEYMGEQIQQVDLGATDMKMALESEAYRRIEHSWSTTNPFVVCREFCAQPPPPPEQAQGTDTVVVFDLKKPL